MATIGAPLAPPGAPKNSMSDKIIVYMVLLAFVVWLIATAGVFVIWSRVQAPAPVVTPGINITPIAPIKPPDPVLASPTPDADLESILTYLLNRRTRIDGTPWSSEALTALRTTAHWVSSGGTGSERTYTYSSGFNTQNSWLLYYDNTSGVWSLRVQT